MLFFLLAEVVSAAFARPPRPGIPAVPTLDNCCALGPRTRLPLPSAGSLLIFAPIFYRGSPRLILSVVPHSILVLRDINGPHGCRFRTQAPRDPWILSEGGSPTYVGRNAGRLHNVFSTARNLQPISCCGARFVLAPRPYGTAGCYAQGPFRWYPENAASPDHSSCKSVQVFAERSPCRQARPDGFSVGLPFGLFAPVPFRTLTRRNCFSFDFSY